jgi:hypothetical protein
MAEFFFNAALIANLVTAAGVAIAPITAGTGRGSRTTPLNAAR